MLCVSNVGSRACVSVGKLFCTCSMETAASWSGHQVLRPCLGSECCHPSLCLDFFLHPDFGAAGFCLYPRGENVFLDCSQHRASLTLWRFTDNKPHFDPLRLTGLPLETCKAVVNPFTLHCFALLSPLVKLEVPEREAARARARARAHIIHTLWTSPRVTQIRLRLLGFTTTCI